MTLYLVTYMDADGEVLIGAASNDEEANQLIVAREQRRLEEILQRESIKVGSPAYERIAEELKARLTRYRSAIAG